MGTVAVTLRVMPEGTETDLEFLKKEIKNKIENGAELKSIEEKPIAFGLKALDVLFLMQDRGGTDDIEEALRSIEGVSSVESLDVTLL